MKTVDDKQALAAVIRFRVGSRLHKDMAAKGGLDPTTMSHFASGNRYPRPANLKRLAVALECSVSTLREAVARVLAVAESGGDDAEIRQALQRHFAGTDDEDTSKVDKIRDPTLGSLLKNLITAVSELMSYLASTRTPR